MSIEIVKAVLTFFGGVGMFVYGMQVMAEGLQQAAGEKTKHLLEVLTSNRLMGVLVGAAVTAIIQSSGATTVMVVGFVNAQLMSLQQAVGVIMGANVGTTMTAWLVSLSEWGSFLKPEMIAPLLMVIGVVLDMVSKNERTKEGGHILIGFGLLFMGLSTMSGAITPYADAPIFTQAFTWIGSNPLLGLLVGALVTAIMQSSSASMGILQTLALSGIVNWGSAVFIALGQNIGTCVVALISAIGADTNAKRAAMIHLEFNTIGALIVGAAALGVFALNPSLMQMNVSSTSLAVFHTSFNIVSTIILLPFANGLVALSKLIIPTHVKVETESHMVRLDDRLLRNPGFAMSAIKNEMQYMGKMALENIEYSRDCLLENKHFDKLKENEDVIDQFYREIGEFISHMDTSSLNEKEHMELRHMFLALRDIEHVSDRCMEIAGLAQKYIDQKDFSETAVEDINTLSTQCYKAFKYALDMRQDRTRELVEKVDRYEDKIDNMEKFMREGHLRKVSDNKENLVTSLIFLEAVDRYERIADHAKLLAHYTAEEEGFDTHSVFAAHAKS